jgi:hypothetical protein
MQPQTERRLNKMPSLPMHSFRKGVHSDRSNIRKTAGPALPTKPLAVKCQHGLEVETVRLGSLTKQATACGKCLAQYRDILKKGGLAYRLATES